MILKMAEIVIFLVPPQYTSAIFLAVLNYNRSFFWAILDEKFQMNISMFVC